MLYKYNNINEHRCNEPATGAQFTNNRKTQQRTQERTRKQYLIQSSRTRERRSERKWGAVPSAQRLAQGRAGGPGAAAAHRAKGGTPAEGVSRATACRRAAAAKKAHPGSALRAEGGAPTCLRLKKNFFVRLRMNLIFVFCDILGFC